MMNSGQTFYQYVMTYRGEEEVTKTGEFAEWLFKDLSYPKHATEYNEISIYLELNSPFPDALKIFDDLWEHYKTHL